MDQPRPEKVAVVDEVRERLSASKAVLLTEYRGINVDGMAELRRALREAGGEYKVYKNTLVRLATRELGHDLDDLLVGPTALAFVPDTEGADPALVAKALKAFGKDNPELIVKGGLLGDRFLSAAELFGAVLDAEHRPDRRALRRCRQLRRLVQVGFVVLVQ